MSDPSDTGSFSVKAYEPTDPGTMKGTISIKPVAPVLPKIDLVTEKVDYQGQKLSVLYERWDGGDDCFERVLAPVPSVAGYAAAAMRYMTDVIHLSMRLASKIWDIECVRRAKELARKEMKSEHINADGEFVSDKYPWCLPGFVPLKLTDRMAQPHLWRYACIRAAVDQQFSDDLCACLRAAGYDDVPPFVGPVRKKGSPASQFQSDKGFGDVERDEHGARIIYWQQFPSERVNVKFLDRKGDLVDPDAGDDIWSHCWLASAPGIYEHAVAYIELFSDRAEAVVRLDYSDPCHSFRLPRGKKLSDFDKIEIGYHNMELRGSPPPWSPGALQPK